MIARGAGPAASGATAASQPSIWAVSAAGLDEYQLPACEAQRQRPPPPPPPPPADMSGSGSLERGGRWAPWALPVKSAQLRSRTSSSGRQQAPPPPRRSCVALLWDSNCHRSRPTTVLVRPRGRGRPPLSLYSQRPKKRISSLNLARRRDSLDAFGQGKGGRGGERPVHIGCRRHRYDNDQP